MASVPYMRLYVNDLFGDTVMLSDAEFGSYVAILMAMWKSGGWLTLDQARKASRVAAGRWAKRWAALAGYFEIEGDGRITQQRVRDDLQSHGKLNEQRSRGVSAETKKQVSAETTNSGPKALKNNNATSNPSRERARIQNPESLSVLSPSGDNTLPFADFVAPEKPRRGKRIAEDWEPSEADRMWAIHTEGLTDDELNRATDEFRNYWLSRSRDAAKLDWSRAWRARIAEISPRIRRNRPNMAAGAGFARGGRSGVEDFASIVARRRGYGAD